MTVRQLLEYLVQCDMDDEIIVIHDNDVELDTECTVCKEEFTNKVNVGNGTIKGVDYTRRNSQVSLKVEF